MSRRRSMRRMLHHWGDIVAEGTKRSGELVVGIDPVREDIPEVFGREVFGSGGKSLQWLRDYLDFVIDVVAPHIAFVKFQSAFYEAYGSTGVEILAGAIKLAKRRQVAVILDAKRGDIGSTAMA